MWKKLALSLALPVAAALTATAQDAPKPAIAVTHDAAAKKVTVTLGGTLFTEYLYSGFAKPVLYPIIGPGGVPMTRNWPIKDAAPNEEKDHPHHKSLFFMHGDVNGTDFWTEDEKTEKRGTIKTTGITKAEVVGGEAVIQSEHVWMGPGEKPFLTDTTVITLGEKDGDRYVDYLVTLHGTSGDATFGDTKEGTMGIRTRPELQLNPDKCPVALAKALNSEGIKQKKVWGEKARWLDYAGPVDGKVIGVAIFDHPKNLNFPTTWHARDYGLIAANPFGVHDFSKNWPGGQKPKDAGAWTLKSGENKDFHYRFLFHPGATKDANIEAKWKAWAGQ